LQHHHSFSDILTSDLFQSKACALSCSDEWHIYSFPLNVPDCHGDKVVGIIWSLHIKNVDLGNATIHIVSPLWIVPEFTTPATTAPVYGTEKVSLIKNSAGWSTMYCPWKGRMLRNVLTNSIPSPVTFDTRKIGQIFKVVNLL